MARETELLFAAAASGDDAEARRLASEARDLMLVRRARWFTGADAYLAEAENLFLGLEGSGQWAGHRWLVDRRGGRIAADAAEADFARRGKSWSQLQGLALVRAVERIGGPGWRKVAFGSGETAGLGMLEEALKRR